jgi:hypothetical protein
MHYDTVQSMGFLLLSVAPLNPGFDLRVFMRGVIVSDQMER